MIINNFDLKNTDYTIISITPPQIFSFTEVIENMVENEYSRLENYFKEGYEFIRFHDEEVIIKNSDDSIFRVFGKNREGFFCIDEEGKIWIIPFATSGYKAPILINSTLNKFRMCYCLLLSIFFVFNAKDINQNMAKKIALDFSDDIKNIDPSSEINLFYSNYIYSIENSELPTHFHPIDYIDAGRHFI